MFKKGDGIAQILCEKVASYTYEEIKELFETTRGEGGFGSTGTDKIDAGDAQEPLYGSPFAPGADVYCCEKTIVHSGGKALISTGINQTWTLWSYCSIAITISPDGHLFQVEYAQEAITIRGKDCFVLGVAKKSMETLQDKRTVRKIFNIDEHVMLDFTDPFPVGYIALFIANTKQRYTQSPGRRPFGLSLLIGGFAYYGTPLLIKTEPSRAYYEYLASSNGRGEKPILVQSGAQNIEIFVMKIGKTRKLGLEEVEALLKVVEDERVAAEAEEAAKKNQCNNKANKNVYLYLIISWHNSAERGKG
uniref:Proteasome alpha-type subunits domain-containing protein n=1 Tax=Panagrolaimus davidi TaxID=227884 RepID=A0A914P6V8_9BILA